MDERTSAYAKNRIPNLEMDSDFLQVMAGREKASTLYAKQRDEGTKLEDFAIQRVIG